MLVDIFAALCRGGVIAHSHHKSLVNSQASVISQGGNGVSVHHSFTVQTIGQFTSIGHFTGGRSSVFFNRLRCEGASHRHNISHWSVSNHRSFDRGHHLYFLIGNGVRVHPHLRGIGHWSVSNHRSFDRGHHLYFLIGNCVRVLHTLTVLVIGQLATMGHLTGGIICIFFHW